MPKALILGNSSGGLYDFRNEILLRLKEVGCEVVVSLPDDLKNKEFEEEGVRVVHTDINRRGVNPVQDLKLYRAYRKLLKKEKPDIVLTYTIKPNIYGGYACSKLGIPYISTITGLGSAFEREGILKKLIVAMYKTGLKKCECIFFQNIENKGIFESLAICGKSAELVNGSGVDLDRHKFEEFPGHKDDVTRFLYVGRLMKEKGSAEYFEAAKALHKKYGYKVSVAAIGYCEDDFKDRMQELQSDGSFKLIDFNPNVHPFLREADAVVMPSYHEGMSNVLMEASATGRPVLASDISGCREIVDDGESGFLFQPKSAGALLTAMVKFMECDEARRRDMGKKARAKMEREFDRHSIIDKYMVKIKEFL